MPDMNVDPAFAQRERQIVPFNLEATLYTFKNASDGGTKSVLELKSTV
jgi:hypothetical protein